MTESANYYLRVRGKVKGPFDLEGLHTLVRRGILSRVHELSTDGKTWITAGRYAELFETEAAIRARSQPSEAEPTEESPPEESASAAASPADAGADAQYYYSQNGSAVGPVGLPILRLLAGNGTIQPDDLIWRENADAGIPARQVPALATILSSRGGHAETGGRRQLDDPMVLDRRSLVREVTRVDRLSGAIGLSVGIGLLICLNLPWFFVEGKPAWWWDLYRVPGSENFATLLTALVLAAVCSCVVAPVVRGTARGIIYMSLIGLCLLFLIVALAPSQPGPTTDFGLLASACLAGLIAICAFRPVAPNFAPARVVQGILSGVVLLDSLMTMFLWMSEEKGMAGAPGSVIFGIILAFTAMICGLTAGILGFAGLRANFNSALNHATWACALAAAVLPAIAILAVTAGAMQMIVGPLRELQHSDLQIAQMHGVIVGGILRSIAIIYGCLAVLGIGLLEVLMNLYAQPRLRAAA